MGYSWVIAANPWGLNGLVLHLIEIANPINGIGLFGCKFLHLIFLFLQCLHYVVLSRRRLFLFLLNFYYIVHIGLLVSVFYFDFSFLWPLISFRVLSWTRNHLINFGLVIEVVSSLGYMFLWPFRRRFFLVLFGIKVLFFNMIALNSAKSLAFREGVYFLGGEGW